MTEAPKLKDLPQLYSFLGLVNYYHRFLSNLSTFLHLLHQLLQKGHTWSWTKACEKAFTEVKTSIASVVVLPHYDPNRPRQLTSDASPFRLGSVLSQVMEDGEE